MRLDRRVRNGENSIRRIRAGQQAYFPSEYSTAHEESWFVSGREIVTMMQTAEPRHGDHFATSFGICGCSPPARRLLRKSKMGSVLMIVADVIGHETLQMALVEDDDMIKEIASATSDESLGNAVLPRALERRSFRLHTKGVSAHQTT